MRNSYRRLRRPSREQVLDQYLRGRLTREEAIERVGIELIELVEQQHAAMSEDLAWAKRGADPSPSLPR